MFDQTRTNNSAGVDRGFEEPRPPNSLVVLLRPNRSKTQFVGDAVHLPGVVNLIKHFDADEEDK
jgi:hypothetical protein